MSPLRPKIPSMDRPREFYEQREVFLFLANYMEEYNLDGTPIFSADISYIFSSNFSVQKCQKMLNRVGKQAALHNAG